ncbi:MAG: prolyl oligopeptidase family serine peptidase [Anaeromyxobacter sp.]
MSRRALTFGRSAAVTLCLALGCHPAAGGRQVSQGPGSQGPSAPALQVAAGAAAERDGAILALRPILVTERSEYYAITYRSSGLRVNGFLGRPRGAGQHPAVIFNRGGNRQFGLLDPRVLSEYVEAGYVAVGSQYRGNGGSEGREAMGGADVEDVLSLVPLLRALPDVDAARVAMVGYSRGGMMTYLALREEARSGRHAIRAAATVGGVADQAAMLERRPEMLPVFLATIGCEPSECPEDYRARSAVYWAGELDVPLLLLHGEADDRVPVEQARRVAQVMAAAGREVKLVTYPGDDHGLSAHRFGRPDILRFFGERLGMSPETYAEETLAPALRDVIQRWPAPAE